MRLQDVDLRDFMQEFQRCLSGHHGVVSVGKDGGALEIELRPDNPDFKPLRLRKEDGQIRVIAEFLEVVG